MAGICDICGGKTGFRNSFRCQDGVICKNCYRIVSNNFSSTIAGSTLLELKKTYIRNAQPLDMGTDGFQITKKLGSFLLLDERGRKFCLLSNRSLTKEYARPEIYRYEDLESFALASEPGYTAGELQALSQDRGERAVVRRLSVRLRFQDGAVREILTLPSPVRTSSFAFRKALQATEELLQALGQITC